MPDPTDQTPPPRQTRPFAAVLQEFDRGRLHAELSAALQDITGAALETGKPGSVSVTIKVVPEKGATNEVRIEAVPTVKVPRRVRRNLYFVDDQHNLTRDHPTQPTLPMQVVGAAAPEARTR